MRNIPAQAQMAIIKDSIYLHPHFTCGEGRIIKFPFWEKKVARLITNLLIDFQKIAKNKFNEKNDN